MVYTPTDAHIPGEAAVVEHAETDHSFMVKQAASVYLCSTVLFTTSLCDSRCHVK